MLSWLQPVTELFNQMLFWFHGLTGDWAIAVTLLTLSIRLLLFTFNMKNAKQQLRQAKLQPLLAELRKKHAQDRERLLQETLKLYGRYGVKPLFMIISALLQAPVFLCLYHLFAIHGSSMASSLISWVSSLGQADPYHLLPVIYAFMTFMSMIVPLTPEISVAGSMMQRAGLPFIFVTIMTSVMWGAPIALALYGTTNALFTLMERGFYRTPWGKRLLLAGVPEIA
jgi:YidC/Oxa1 family membrane protein insertase